MSSPFAKSTRDAVTSVGEEGLIALVRRWLGRVCPPPPAGIGDDCAVVPPTRGPLLLKSDPVVYRRHFDDRVPARSVGAKLLKRNLSDIAAMGGAPTAAVVSLLIDKRTSLGWLRGFHHGLAAVARRYGVAIVGGDISEAPGAVSASLTLLGRVPSGRAVTRAGARTGDWIFVTGVLGLSLKSGHHFRFEPRLAEGAWLARQAAVRAMIDVSDGLAKEARLLSPRGCAPALDASVLPRRPGASIADALSGGEDYELLFAISGGADRAAFLRRWRLSFPRTRLTCIGRFVPAGRLPAGAIPLSRYSGYEHLARRFHEHREIHR